MKLSSASLIAMLSNMAVLRKGNIFASGFRTLATPKRCTAFRRLSSPSDFITTQYTISCPPTEVELLHRTVRKNVIYLEQYLTRKPIAPHTTAAFELALREIKELSDNNSSIILDSGCGTGRSSLVLGQLFPKSVVLGVDRSLVRLERNPLYDRPATPTQDDDTLVQQVAGNVWLVRAELVDFWTCARQAGIAFERHYLLYPNPYPKKARLQYRWYAHPSFPLLLQTSPYIVVRSNWKLYLEELASAVRIVSDVWETELPAKSSFPLHDHLTPLEPRRRSPSEPAWTNFEEKYQRAGEPTFELVLDFRPADK